MVKSDGLCKRYTLELSLVVLIAVAYGGVSN